MNIYLITANESVDYDSIDSFCIVANSEEEVRNMAQESGADESHNWDENSYYVKISFWTNVDKTTIELVGTYLGEEVEPFILISSFNAG
jgi:hypothetical protein